jgi:hypothetical protein
MVIPRLALQIGVVHRALGDALVGAEDAALMEQGVDQRGLAVIDVRDDGDVADGGIGDRTHQSSGFLGDTLTGRKPRGTVHGVDRPPACAPRRAQRRE